MFTRVLLMCIVALSGCSSQQLRAVGGPPTFPPPPAEPRFIYDTTLRDSKDVQPLKFGDKLRGVATGVTIQPLGLAKPYDVAVKRDRVYVTDTQQRAILMFDGPGQRFELFGDQGDGRVLKPLGIDISNGDEIFVVDGTARRVIVYDLEGRFLRAIGNAQQLTKPSGVAVSPDGTRVYVVDTGGIDSERHHILVYDAQSGALLQTIGRRGTAKGEFNLPLQAAVAADGTLYVVDSGNFRIQSFDANGMLLQVFGTIGRRSGQFSRPKGIAVDGDNNIYIVDTAFGNFQVFSRHGKLLLHVGERATADGPARYMLPAGIDVDEQGRIYIVDQFFRKVDVFRPAHEAPLEDLPPTIKVRR